MTKHYFLDKDHIVMDEYYDFIDGPEKHSPDAVERKMKVFIKEDPLFLDPYLMLFELYQDKEDFEMAEEILEQAYKIAIKIITDKKGNWPSEMPWGHLENRHIIRTFLNKALNLWLQGKNEDALDLLRKLLRSNPNDNIGARTYILAIRLGMKFGQFEKRMASKYGGYDGMKMMEFEKKMKDFPDEFSWWFEATSQSEH